MPQQPRACLLVENFALIGNEQLLSGTEHMARSFLPQWSKCCAKWSAPSAFEFARQNGSNGLELNNRTSSKNRNATPTSPAGKLKSKRPITMSPTRLTNFGILGSRLGQDPSSDFKKLLKVADERILNSIQGLSLPEKPALNNFLPKEPSIFVRWFPFVTSSFQKRLSESKTRFDLAQASYENIVRKRSDYFATMKKNINEQNNAVVEFARSYTMGERNAVCTYFELILGRHPRYFRERKLL